MTVYARFKQADVARAIRAVEACGKTASSVKIDRDGAIVVTLGEIGRAHV